MPGRCRYTIELAPFVEVEFSYLAPDHRRVSCSWGIEIRSDPSGRQLILMHGAKSYLVEEGKPVDSLASSTDSSGTAQIASRENGGDAR